ncbi:hypothetical protein [uncultured Methylobacterium sp.]|jgi:hypothetical protein|uniref:hypothetical protein n=1 Tax=uncultured Methylobacterium sp. TaxID=157278 RepID=UPI002609F022|nr:hypothetical protein [uncultured Methylobacterium sp.]
MHRLVAVAALMSALLAAPALAGGQPLPPRAGYPPVVRSAAGPVPAPPPRAFAYGETDGVIVEAWLPRNERLPIYNIPPRVFPEW